MREDEFIVGRLIVNFDAGEGRVFFSDDFLEESGLFRADVLKDLISELEQEYDRALEDEFGVAS